MADFASQPGSMLSQAPGTDVGVATPRVADKTGLTGKYDFSMDFDCRGCGGITAAMRANMPQLAARPTPEATTDPGSGLPNIFNANRKATWAESGQGEGRPGRRNRDRARGESPLEN